MEMLSLAFWVKLREKKVLRVMEVHKFINGMLRKSTESWILECQCYILRPRNLRSSNSITGK